MSNPTADNSGQPGPASEAALNADTTNTNGEGGAEEEGSSDDEFTNLDEVEEEADEEGDGEEGQEGEDGEGDGEEGDGDKPDPANATAEDFEIEVNGKKFKLPAEVRDAVMMRQDYSRKTGELAEAKKTFAAEQSAGRAHIRELAQFTAINDQVETYETKVDWQRLLQEDPDLYHSEKQRFEDLKTQGRTLLSTIQKNEQAALEKQRDEHAKRLEQSHDVLTKDIGWNPKLAGEVLDFGVKNYGFTANEIANIHDPRMIKVLHAAMKATQQQAVQKKVERTITAQKTQPAPQARSSSQPTVNKDPLRAKSDGDYFRLRKAQIGG